MYILPINYSYRQNNIKPTFTGITNTISRSGSLEYKTSSAMSYVMRAFREIEEKLGQITIEGRKALLDKFPNLKITDTMTFSNCGDEKYSIIINRASDYHTNNGLVKIVTVNNPETKSEQRESFVVERENKLLKDNDPNNQRFFPPERIYLSQDEISSQKINDKLNKICNDLDLPLLEIRKFLTINMQKYSRTPDGVIPYDTNKEFGYIRKTFTELSELYKEIPKKRVLELKRQFPKFLLVSGQQYPVFKNLGDDNLTVGFSPVESAKADGLLRMQVYEEDGTLKRVFTIKDNKFVKNIKEAEHFYIPDFFTYVDANEINEEKYLPEFKKYLALYERELNTYKSYTDNIVKKYNEVRVPGEFNNKTTQKLATIHSKYAEVKTKIKKLPKEVASSAKNEYESYKQSPNGQGIIFIDSENDKEIFYLPIRSNAHSDLLKLSITDTKTNVTKSYLIHEDKYVVKNYNPGYTTLPRILTYMTNDELEDVEIEKYLDFLEKNMDGFNKKLAAYHSTSQPSKVSTEKRPLVKQPSKVTTETRPSIKQPRGKIHKSNTVKCNYAQKTLIQECTSMLKDTLSKELDFGLRNLDSTLSEIRRRVQEYLKMQNN